jgi:hypothetical protein
VSYGILGFLARAFAVFLQKAEAKLQARFTKAEAVGECPGDATAAVEATTACVTAFTGATAGDAGCTAAKIKAAGKKTAGKSACAKKAAVKGIAIEACLAQVEQKFTKAVAKADRKGSVWYLGGMTGDSSQDLILPLGFLGGQTYTGTIWSDGPDAETDPDQLVVEPLRVSGSDELRVRLAAGGGFVVELTPRMDR